MIQFQNVDLAVSFVALTLAGEDPNPRARLEPLSCLSYSLRSPKVDMKNGIVLSCSVELHGQKARGTYVAT